MQEQPQVLRLRGSHSAVSHFDQDDKVFWIWKGGERQGQGQGEAKAEAKAKANAEFG